KKSTAVFNESRSWQGWALYRSAWEANVEEARARLAETRGRYAEAEAGYRKARIAMGDAMAKSPTWPSPQARSVFESAIDQLTAWEGRTKYRQGRLAEAEIDIRRALLSRLKAVGKYNAETASISLVLATLVSEQARPAESEKLARAAVEIYDALGYRPDSIMRVTALGQLAGTLYTQRRFDEANAVFNNIDGAIANWNDKLSARFKYGWSRVFTAYMTPGPPNGNGFAGAFLGREKGRAA